MPVVRAGNCAEMRNGRKRKLLVEMAVVDGVEEVVAASLQLSAKDRGLGGCVLLQVNISWRDL